jgi:hypothetical protein
MPEPIVVASVAAPWGPIRVAASGRGIVAIDQLVSADAFLDRLERRFRSHPLELADAPTGSPAVAHLREALAALQAFLAGDGSLGGYGGGWWGGRQTGLELKRELLAREGVEIGAAVPRGRGSD